MVTTFSNIQTRQISTHHRIRVNATQSSLAQPYTAMADFASVMQKVEDGLELQQQLPSATAAAKANQQNLKLYKARWIILAVFMVYSMSNAIHWIQYSIISNITGKFYGVSNFAIDTTSTIYMIMYVPLVVPASWVLDRLVSAPYIVVPLPTPSLGTAG